MLYTGNDQIINEYKKLLIDENVSQAEISKRLGIKPQGLNKIFTKKHITLDDMKKLLSALGYDVSVEFKKKTLDQ